MSLQPNSGAQGEFAKKNIKIFCGKPLIYWNLIELENCNQVDEIVVASDSEDIISVVEGFKFSKVVVYRRSNENAQDHSTSESIMLEYINFAKLDLSDVFMLVQATSPFTKSNDFSNGLKMMNSYDTVFSCAKIKRFIWDKDSNPLNYDFKNRPRRQDFDGTFMENGAFCISLVSDIIKYNNRISGNIGICEMQEYTYVEIDEPEDWIIEKKIIFKK